MGSATVPPTGGAMEAVKRSIVAAELAATRGAPALAAD